MPDSQNARHMSHQRLNTADLAHFWTRYKDAGKDDVTVQDLLLLWWEVDTLRFELAAAAERTKVAREERDSLQDQLYQVRARLPGAGGKI